MALAFATFRTYLVLSLLLATAVVSHAAYHKRFFYRTMVYLGDSKLAIFAAANLALVSVILVWKAVQKVFLGPLRFREMERLNSRARNAIIECCFATTIFREEVNLLFLALVTTLLMLKSLHWLTKDRMDFLEEQPLSPRSAHVRLVGLMSLLLFTDMYLVWECAKTTFQSKDGTMFVLFAFEFTVLLIDLSSDFVRYIFHVIDLRCDGRWDDKGLYSFYNELVTDMCQLTVYLAFFLYVNTYYTFPIHILREVYVTFTKFQRRCSDFIRYRRVVSTMNDRFPDATEEELADGDRTCIICREEMPEAKKLACGHMFHARCLQSWLKRQLSCPTCRSNVDVNPISPDNRARAGLVEAGAPQNDGRVPPPPDDADANGPSFWQQANRLWQHIAYGAPRDGGPPPPRAPDALEQAQARAQQPRARGIWPNIRFGLRVERRQLGPRWPMPGARPPNGPAPDADAPPAAGQAPPPMPRPDWAAQHAPAPQEMPQFDMPPMQQGVHNFVDQPFLQQPHALNQLIAIQENIGGVRDQLDALRDQVQRLVVEATDAMAAAAVDDNPAENIDAQTEPHLAGTQDAVEGGVASAAREIVHDAVHAHAVSPDATPVAAPDAALDAAPDAANDAIPVARAVGDHLDVVGSGAGSSLREQMDLRQKRLAFLEGNKKSNGGASSSAAGASGINNGSETTLHK